MKSCSNHRTRRSPAWGPAAVRDTISRLKYGAAGDLSINQGAIKRAIAFGISQSGRFLRTYLYYGFNEDEAHRKVFDGVMSHVAGGGRGSFDNRFALPSRTAGPFSSFFYPVDIFPFTDVAQLDPETGRRDGLLTHNMKPEFMPKVMYTNSSHEYWGRAASLFTTTIDGKEDAPMMSNVRAYMYTGGNHGIAAFPPTRGSGQQLERSARLSMGRPEIDGLVESLDYRRGGTSCKRLPAHQRGNTGRARQSKIPEAAQSHATDFSQYP